MHKFKSSPVTTTFITGAPFEGIQGNGDEREIPLIIKCLK